jgi:phosphonate transport system substrate-binding protein
LALTFCVAAAAGCVAEPQVPVGTLPVPSVVTSSTAELTFAVHPLHNPLRLYELFQPLADLIGHECGFALRLEASRSYEAFEHKLAARLPDIALPNPYQVRLARRSGYRVIAKQGDDERFRGLLLARRDSGLVAVEQVRGSTVAFPAPTALAATMMPELYLAEHGLLAGRDYRRVFVGSQESAIVSVLLGRATYGATWPVPWEAFQRERPASASELRVAWQTPSLVNNAVVVRDDLSSSRASCVRRALVDVAEHEAGRGVLARIGVSKFEPADETTYDPVDGFLDRYIRLVGPLP